MAVRKILVEIVGDDIDIEEYIDAIEDACREVEARPMIAGETKITVGEIP